MRWSFATKYYFPFKWSTFTHNDRIRVQTKQHWHEILHPQCSIFHLVTTPGFGSRWTCLPLSTPSPAHVLQTQTQAQAECGVVPAQSGREVRGLCDLRNACDPVRCPSWKLQWPGLPRPPLFPPLCTTWTSGCPGHTEPREKATATRGKLSVMRPGVLITWFEECICVSEHMNFQLHYHRSQCFFYVWLFLHLQSKQSFLTTNENGAAHVVVGQRLTSSYRQGQQPRAARGLPGPLTVRRIIKARAQVSCFLPWHFHNTTGKINRKVIMKHTGLVYNF